MCSIPLHTIPFRSHPPVFHSFPHPSVFPVFPVGCGVDVLCVLVVVVGPKGNGRRLVGFEWRPCLVVLEFRRRREGVRPRGCVQIAFLFSFWELGSMHVWEDLDVLVIYFPCSLPPLLFRDRRRASFSSERTVVYLCRFVSPLPSFSTFSSLFSIPSLSPSPFSFFVDIIRLSAPWADLPFSVFFFSDQQPPTGPYTRGAKIRPSCSVDLWSYAWKVGISSLSFFFFWQSRFGFFLLSWIRVSQP